jgi:hypothetical protein
MSPASLCQQPIEAPSAAACNGEIEEDEAVCDDRNTAIEDREKAARRVRPEVRDGHFPAAMKAAGRVNRPRTIKGPQMISTTPPHHDIVLGVRVAKLGTTGIFRNLPVPLCK